MELKIPRVFKVTEVFTELHHLLDGFIECFRGDVDVAGPAEDMPVRVDIGLFKLFTFLKFRKYAALTNNPAQVDNALLFVLELNEKLMTIQDLDFF